MHIVVFHVEPDAAALAKIAASCQTFHADTDYRRLLNILFDSANLFHRGARLVLLTDQHTPLDSLPQSVEVRRCDVDPNRVMFSRMQTQIEYLRSQDGDDGVVFLDSDMIVNGSLAPLLAEDFDIALTYRNYAEMPLNGGFIAVQGGACGAGVRFLERALAIYADQFTGAQHWWGDQQALITAIGREQFAKRQSDRLAVDGVRFRFLTCDRFNFSPENELAAIDSELSQQKILHFKGERKRLMPLYWNRYLAQRMNFPNSKSNAMSNDPVRVFIGTGEASLLERKVLIHSLRKNSKRPIDVYVMNGTHNAIEKNNETPVLAPMSLRVKYRNYTEFSLYRYLIPQLCGHQGRGIYLDSDMICLGDIGELFDAPMHGNDFLSIKAYDTGQWGPSVMLIDCAKCRFDLEQICDEIDASKYTYSEFTRMDDRFLAHHPLKIGVLDPNWNVFDRHDQFTQLIHYTNLMSQPWKFPGHPFGELWFSYFRDALAKGTLTEDEVTKAITRGYVRPTIREGNQSAPPLAVAASKTAAKPAKKQHWLKRFSRRLRGKAA